MCLGLVMKVISIDDKEALCDYLGNRRKIRIDVIKDVSLGDYLLIHAGFAISKLSKEEGEERLDIFKEIQEKIGEISKWIRD